MTMQLPEIVETTAFDRFNAAIYVVTFQSAVSPHAQEQLCAAALGFHPNCVDDCAIARFYLEFDSTGRKVTIRQRCGGGTATTLDEFQQLLRLLDFELPGAATSISKKPLQRKIREHADIGDAHAAA